MPIWLYCILSIIGVGYSFLVIRRRIRHNRSLWAEYKFLHRIFPQDVVQGELELTFSEWKKHYLTRPLYKFSFKGLVPYLRHTNLNFYYPEEMKVNYKYRVRVNIQDSNEVEINNLNSGESHLIIAGDIMKCVLLSDGFNITSFNSEAQALISQYNTEWLWEIQPIKKGRQRLSLRVSAQIKVNDQVAIKDIPVFERYVFVEVNTPYQVKKFCLSNWQWIIGTLVGSGLVWQLLKLLFRTS